MTHSDMQTIFLTKTFPHWLTWSCNDQAEFTPLQGVDISAFLHSNRNVPLTPYGSHLSWQKLKNDIQKIKRLLFLNPFDHRHIPRLVWKVVCGLLVKFFFLTEKIFCIWLDTDVAGEFRNKMEPSQKTGQIPYQIWGQYHQKILCPGSFPKRIFGDSKRTHEN